MLMHDFLDTMQIKLWLEKAMVIGFWLGYSAGFITSGSILFIIYYLIGR